jgi:hypothetical protein
LLFWLEQTLAEMMDSSKDNDVKWGNQIGYIVLPFHIAMHDDPLEFIRQGKKTADRKKRSLEAVFTYWSGNLVVKLLGIKVHFLLQFETTFSHLIYQCSVNLWTTKDTEFCLTPACFIGSGSSMLWHVH